MKGVIRLGDPTSHGGSVVQASPSHRVMGRSVARVGDRCICPMRGHENCVIAEGDPKVLSDGIPVAFDGHRTSCGARLISTQSSSGRT